MKPCMKCTTASFNSKVIPIVPSKYPCRITADENEVRRPSREIYKEESKTTDEKKEGQKETIPKNKDPCQGIQIPLGKKFKIQKINNCQLSFSRAWEKNESENSFKNGVLPKWLRRHQKFPESIDCTRDLNEYERKLRIPICKQPIKPPAEVIFVPIDEAICVFCLGSLYTGGYLHDIYQKMPYIKKQSEENNDEIILRIGNRSRITVHKKCYNAYIDRSKPENETKEKDDDSDSDDMGCDGERKESEEGKMGEKMADLVTVKKENFWKCLKKTKLPKLPSGKCCGDLYLKMSFTWDPRPRNILVLNSIFGVKSGESALNKTPLVLERFQGHGFGSFLVRN